MLTHLTSVHCSHIVNPNARSYLASAIENGRYEAIITTFYKHWCITNGAEGETGSKVSQFQSLTKNDRCILPIPLQTNVSC
jgi:hypothetical protein